LGRQVRLNFSDFTSYQATDRTAISVRDGVLEYLGAELGLEPKDRVFSVYRSPATIANAAYAMTGIPLTDGHVDLAGPAPDTGSKVEAARVIDQLDEATGARLAVMNRLSVTDQMALALQDKQELSLGYGADLIPHSRYDFEQTNIEPHHLAVVEAGRCGPGCRFLDRKAEGDKMSKKIHKVFLDAEGGANLEQIVEIAAGLPDAIRKVPVDKLPEILPALQEIMGYAREQGVEVEGEKVADEDGAEDKKSDQPTTDQDGAEEEKKSEFSDAETVRKLIKSEVRKYGEVVTKARDFLDEDYEFTDKSANQIMRDALATQYAGTTFTDAEIGTAFKLLKRQAPDYSKFGDQKPDGSLTARLKSAMEG